MRNAGLYCCNQNLSNRNGTCGTDPGAIFDVKSQAPQRPEAESRTQGCIKTACKSWRGFSVWQTDQAHFAPGLRALIGLYSELADSGVRSPVPGPTAAEIGSLRTACVYEGARMPVTGSFRRLYLQVVWARVPKTRLAMSALTRATSEDGIL